MKVNLTLKILFAVTVVVVVILSALAFLVVSSQRDLLYNSQRNLGMEVAKSLDARIDTREKVNNTEALQADTDRAVRMNPTLVEAYIALPQKANLEIIGSSNQELIGEEVSEKSLSVFQDGELLTETFSSEDQKMMRVISPVYVGNQRIGVYHLKFSLKQAEQMISKIQKRFIYGILAVIPQLIIILYLLLRRTVLSPINKLRKGAEAIESGNLEFRVDLDRRDEVGMLAESFNRMAEKVSDFYENLDEKVEERTKELEKTKEKLKNKVSEIRKTKRELEESKKKLEKAQESLKAKVKSRTKKLRELAEKREEIIRRRTKGLRKSRKALMNILEDVEEAKDEAEQERDKNAAMLDNLPEGVLFFNSDKELSSINPQAREFFNMEEADVVGKKLNELKDSPLSQLIELTGEDLKKIRRKELKLREGLIVEVTTVPMTRAQKIGTLVLVHDITREKRVQRMKTEFVSVAAHQLRTPLSGIKWTLKMLLEEELGELNDQQKEFVEKTYKSNKRMISLIKDLLNVSRIEEGRYVYEPEVTSLENLVREVLGNLEEEITKGDIELVFDKPEEPTSVKVDTEKVRLAIKNLVDNAVRYSPEGGRVEVTIEQREEEVQFSVEDNGIGIPKEEQDRIFNKFFRAPNATHKQTEGSGLGLFITKNIIESHDGEIWFESEPEEGTTFYFTLPN
ncbi:MAG: ATP-binding protein, partial [Candidatus Paceibacterota bacterium]